MSAGFHRPSRATTNTSGWPRTDGTVSVIDAVSQRVTSTIHVEPTGRRGSVDGSVWVTNRSDGTASFVAAGATAVSDTMPAGRDPHAIAIASDDVWVASADDGTIWQLGSGPATTPTIVTGSAPTGIALTGADLWVTTVARTDGAHRSGTLHVTADRRPDSIDPAFGYSPIAWSILSMTNDGLVGTGGPTGSAAPRWCPTSQPPFQSRPTPGVATPSSFARTSRFPTASP